LTYNYGVESYALGNDFGYIKIASSKVIENLSKSNYPFRQQANSYEVHDPNGYKFLIDKSDKSESITELGLYVSNLNASIQYWHGTLKGKLFNKEENKVALEFDKEDFKLVLIKSSDDFINRASAYGRIAFSCPMSDLLGLQEKIEKNNYKIHTRYVELKTPGKATVAVVILSDPDAHEICFVGDEGFRELSRVDPNAKQLLENAISKDKSKEWRAKHRKQTN
jgi:hypothetical protein